MVNLGTALSSRTGFASLRCFTRSLSGQLLSVRLGMWQALIAELAHPHLVDRLIWPSPLGTRLANVITDRFFACKFHRNYSVARVVALSTSSLKPAGAVRVGQMRRGSLIL